MATARSEPTIAAMATLTGLSGARHVAARIRSPIGTHLEQLLRYMQTVAGAGVVAFGLAAAVMEWWNRMQRAEDRIATRDWWTERWCKLGDSGWFELPFKVIRTFLRCFEVSGRRLYCYFRCAPPDCAGIAVMVVALIYGAVVLWLLLGWWSLLYCLIGVVLALLRPGWSIVVDTGQGLWFLATSIIVPFALFRLLGHASLPKAFLFLVLAAPLLWLCLTLWATALFVVRGLWRGTHGHAEEPQFMGSPYVEIWALTATVSFVVTNGALLLGTAFDHTGYAPRSTLLLFVNAACDTVSLALVLWVVRWAAQTSTLLRLFVSLVICVICGATLAIASIWLGLAWSDQPLTFRESTRVLIAQHPTGAGVYLGPVFWVMHTVFIPIVLLCVVVLVLAFAKVLLHAAHWYFGKAAVNEKPHHMTAGFLMLLAATCAAVKLVGDAAAPAGTPAPPPSSAPSSTVQQGMSSPTP